MDGDGEAAVTGAGQDGTYAGRQHRCHYDVI